MNFIGSLIIANTIGCCAPHRALWEAPTGRDTEYDGCTRCMGALEHRLG
jgi:hypothetical protein